MTGLDVRKNPCASCPYRRDVPSGVWSAEEYQKLPRWDGEIIDQVMSEAYGVFLCHQNGAELCAGWVGHRDPDELLALRMAVPSGHVDPSVMDYQTSVPLFTSGAQACAHGMRDIDAPSDRAVEMAEKIRIKRGL